MRYCSTYIKFKHKSNIYAASYKPCFQFFISATHTHTHTVQRDEDIARLLQIEFDKEQDAEIARLLHEQHHEDSTAAPSGATQHGAQAIELPVMSTLGNQV